jgi:hypothetical protein
LASVSPSASLCSAICRKSFAAFSRSALVTATFDDS